MRILLAAVLALMCGALVTPASAQDALESREAIALQNQIAELRQEVQVLRDQLAHAPQPGGSALGGYQAPPAAAAPPSDITTQLLDRVQRLEDAVRALRGRIDEVDNARQRQGEDLAKQLGDLNFKLENGAALGTPPAAPGRPTTSPPPGNLAGQPPAGAADETPPPPPPAPRRTPELILQEGNTALARKDYAAAAAAAKEVLGAGKGPRMTDAQFLLAQALYGKRDFPGAAVAFDDTYNRSRTGVHAQDSLLGLANALTAINEKRAACDTLDKLRAEFPTPRTDLAVQITVARRGAGCH